MATLGTMQVRIYEVLVAHGGFKVGTLRAYPERSIVAVQGVRRGLLKAASGTFTLDLDVADDELPVEVKPARVRKMKKVQELKDDGEAGL